MTAVGPFDVTRFYGRQSWHPHTREEENKRAGAPGLSAVSSTLQRPDGGDAGRSPWGSASARVSPQPWAVTWGVEGGGKANSERRPSGRQVVPAPKRRSSLLALNMTPGLGSLHGSCANIGSKWQGLGYVCLKLSGSN